MATKQRYYIVSNRQRDNGAYDDVLPLEFPSRQAAAQCLMELRRGLDRADKHFHVICRSQLTPAGQRQIDAALEEVQLWKQLEDYLKQKLDELGERDFVQYFDKLDFDKLEKGIKELAEAGQRST